MLQIMSLLATFLAGKYNKSPYQISSLAVLEQIWSSSRKILAAVTAGLTGSLLVVAGILVSVYEMTSQYDVAGEVIFTSTLASFMFIAVFGAACIALGFYFLQRPVKELPVQQYKAPRPSLIQTALTTFIEEMQKPSTAAMYEDDWLSPSPRRLARRAARESRREERAMRRLRKESEKYGPAEPAALPPAPPEFLH